MIEGSKLSKLIGVRFTKFEDYHELYNLYSYADAILRKAKGIGKIFMSPEELQRIDKMLDGDIEMIELANTIVDAKYASWMLHLTKRAKSKHYIYPKNDHSAYKLRNKHFKSKLR